MQKAEAFHALFFHPNLSLLFFKESLNEKHINMKVTTTLVMLAGVYFPVRSQEAFLALAQAMPECSVCIPYLSRIHQLPSDRFTQLACFTLEIPNSTCATNLTAECMCTDTALNAAVSVCSMKTCTVYELLRMSSPAANINTFGH